MQFSLHLVWFYSGQVDTDGLSEYLNLLLAHLLAQCLRISHHRHVWQLYTEVL